jgi:hypothetical protein
MSCIRIHRHCQPHRPFPNPLLSGSASPCPPSQPDPPRPAHPWKLNHPQANPSSHRPLNASGPFKTPFQTPSTGHNPKAHSHPEILRPEPYPASATKTLKARESVKCLFPKSLYQCLPTEVASIWNVPFSVGSCESGRHITCSLSPKTQGIIICSGNKSLALCNPAPLVFRPENCCGDNEECDGTALHCSLH